MLSSILIFEDEKVNLVLVTLLWQDKYSFRHWNTRIIKLALVSAHIKLIT